MKKAAIIAACVAMSGCSGTIITVLPGAPAASLPILAAGNSPVASAGYASAGDDFQSLPIGSTISVNAMVETDRSISASYATEILTLEKISVTSLRVTYRGNTFTLVQSSASPDMFEVATATITADASYFFGGTAGDLVRINFADSSTGTTFNDQITAMVGYSTAPATLKTIGSASYTGLATLSVTSAVDGSDQSEGVIELTMDFANDSFSGNMTLFDDPNDGTAGTSGAAKIDLTDTLVPIVDGELNGNAFAGVVLLSPEDVGLAKFDPPVMQGQVFGDEAQEVYGVSSSKGITADTNSALVGLTFEATKD